MLTENLRHEIEATITRLMLPKPLIAYMEGLAKAEQTGRIKRAKMSPLNYGLRRFLESNMPTTNNNTIRIIPQDEQLFLTGSDSQFGPWKHEVIYPVWFLDFVEDDERFELLLPGSEAKLEEVLQQIYEWCLNDERYRSLVV